MSTKPSLSISRLIKVDVVLTPSAAQAQSLSDLLVLGSSDVIDVVERIRLYGSLSAVATDFGTTAPEYEAAVAWFGQSPQPTQLYIGRWAETATAGKLIGATLSTAEQAIAVWNAVTNGSFGIAIDGAAAVQISALDFSADTNLNGVASTISAALTGATCTWDATYSRFVFTSATTGAASSVSFLTAGTVGTDISGMLGGLATSSGAYVADGIAAESALDAVTLFDANYGRKWYGIEVAGAQDTDYTAIAAYVEAATNKHVQGVTTQEAGVLSSVTSTDIASLLQAGNYTRSLTQYSSSNAYAVGSMLGRILTTNYNANSSVITLMYKQEPGVTAETLNDTQMSALEGKNCNVFVEYDNQTAIIEKGVMASGDFVDVITGLDWFAVTLQTALYNTLYTSATKIPQTDAGNHILSTVIEKTCNQALANGLLGPGQWNNAGFGSLAQGDFLPKGYYIYAPPISSQTQADREARKSVPFQIALKLAGAIQTIDVIVNVNR